MKILSVDDDPQSLHPIENMARALMATNSSAP
jgi:hypothetical protein